MKNLDFSLEEVSLQLLLITDTRIYGVFTARAEHVGFVPLYFKFTVTLLIPLIKISFPSFVLFFNAAVISNTTFECKTSYLVYNKFRKCISLTQADISVPILYLSSCDKYRQPAEHLGCDNLPHALNS